MIAATDKTKSEWKECKLGDIAGKIGSGATPTGGGNSYKTSGMTFIRSQNVEDFKFSIEGLAFIDEEQASALKNVSVEKNDILMNITGESVTRCCMAPEEYLPARVNQHVAIIRPLREAADFKYVFYYLHSIKPELNSIAEIGCTRRALTKEMLENVVIPLPSIPEQRTIAAVFSSLDDKIDLLHRQNKTLEGMASALWRKMFIEEAGEDWKKTSVGEVISVKGGTTPSSNNPDFWNGDVPWTSPRDLSSHDSVYMFDTSRKITHAGLAQIGSGLLPAGSVLLSSRAPIGYLVITDIEVAINQGYIGIICDKGVSNYYMFIWIRHSMDTIIGAANGSTFLEISKSVFKELEFILPSEKVIESYDCQVSPIFNKIRNNQLQIRSISKLRDTLLPKLMSGEARVEL